MNHPRLTDSEREALQDEYSVMPAAISDEGAMHTPGPWTWLSEEPREVRLKRDHWSVGAVDSRKGVALVFRGEANARLIALAPEMLQELRKIAVDVECYCDDYSAVRGPCGHCAAVAILAKAEGRK
jgi:hypothetical protein